MTVVNGLWLIAVLLFVLLLTRFDRKRGNSYQFSDQLLDPVTGKASLTAHILWAMALMAIWVCIDRSIDGKDADTLVETVLGIFVLGRLGQRGIDAWRPPPPGDSPKGS